MISGNGEDHALTETENNEENESGDDVLSTEDDNASNDDNDMTAENDNNSVRNEDNDMADVGENEITESDNDITADDDGDNDVARFGDNYIGGFDNGMTGNDDSDNSGPKETNIIDDDSEVDDSESAGRAGMDSELSKIIERGENLNNASSSDAAGETRSKVYLASVKCLTVRSQKKELRNLWLKRVKI